jgi:3-oxoadipate enol-lactonase
VARLVEKGFAEVNDARLYYEIIGKGHPLVLVHGFSLDTRMWDDQFEVFAKRFKVVRYDVRGYGKSALPKVGREYSHQNDLSALLNQLGIDYAHAMGHSMGGGIALDFTLEHPESIKALILVDSTLGGFQDWSKTDFDLVKEAKEKGVEAAKNLMMKMPSFLRIVREKPNVASQLRHMSSDYSGWHYINTDPEHTLNPPAIERLQETNAPTLIIVGERDFPDFHRIAEILNEKIIKSKKITLKGAGHNSNMEAPREFNDAVLGFLANSFASSSSSSAFDALC